MRTTRILPLTLLAALALACSGPPRALAPPYRPLDAALASVGHTQNRDATVPAACYTATQGTSNPCWTCHASGQFPNTLTDFDRQAAYDLAPTARRLHWTNLLVDRRRALAALGDDEILRYVREDNYSPLAAALASDRRYQGYVPDLDLAAGFDADGFARDGSGWRALRYKPFPGASWPTNGSTDDVFVRLPPAFRRDGAGAASRAVYAANLDLLADAIGDTGAALPARYLGGAADVPLRRRVYPRGTELLHSVRYLDPDAPSLMARRMKELRYSRKVEELDDASIVAAYDRAVDEDERAFAGGPEVGYRNEHGWQLTGFIEDREGRLRVQTEEEHLACMGCHSSLGVTVDQTFALARKLPGAAGWRPQDLRGIPDVPELGQVEPEILTYFRRVGGGDDLRANDEVLERFFPGGVLAEAEVRRAAPGGDRDILYLVGPSRRRALQLDKAYLLLVREQSFVAGRDVVLAPAAHVQPEIRDASTGLARTGRVFVDGRLALDWRGVGVGRTVASLPPR